MAGTACYLIRKASERDAMRIARIHVKTWQTAYRGMLPDDFLDGLDPGQRAVAWKGLIGAPNEWVLVAVRGSRIVGFCSLLPSRDAAAPPEIAELSTLYVDPREWGKGAGGNLIAAAVDHAASHGFKMLTLWVLSGNARARSFYEKMGFEPDGVEKLDEKLGFPIHELRYWREL